MISIIIINLVIPLLYTRSVQFMVLGFWVTAYCYTIALHISDPKGRLWHAPWHKSQIAKYGLLRGQLDVWL